MTRWLLVLSAALVACGGPRATSDRPPEPSRSIEMAPDASIVDTERPAAAAHQPSAPERPRLAALLFDCSPEALAGAHPSALRLYRSAVFARHGRSFESAELQAAFDAVEGYAPDPTFTDNRLSDEEQACVARIGEMDGRDAPSVMVATDLDGNGEPDQVTWDGTTLTVGGATVLLRLESADSGPVQPPVWIDLNLGDGRRELLVTTAPGIEDEWEFQVVRYHDGRLVPLLPEPTWLMHQEVFVGHETLVHEASNCGQTTTTTWRLVGDQLVPTATTTGTFDERLCAG